MDGGIECGPNERVRFGECVFVCDRDSDCAAGQACNLFTGACEPKGAGTDAGVSLFPCTTGATRCAADNKSVEACDADGQWTPSEVCETDMPCVNGKCQICTPGAASCDPADATKVRVCLDDGTAERVVTCSGTATCTNAQCRECEPETARCSPDGTTLETCKFGQDETKVWAWAASGDGFDGACITQQCLAGPPPVCSTPDCFPGAQRCANEGTQEVCSNTGSWTPVSCASVGPFHECVGQSCINACTAAAAQKSYLGCEYWSAVLDNGALDRFFKNMPSHTDLRQGTADSDFAFVVTNQSDQPTTVQVHRWLNGTSALAKTVTVPGRNDPSRGVAVIKLPWQSIGNTTASAKVATTGQARFAYRLTSTRPVTVYQFNPLDAVRVTKTCSGSEGQPDSSCNELPDYLGGFFGDPNTWGICRTGTTGKRCHYYTYSNDASLLLPRHALGTSYVAISSEQVTTTSLSSTVQANGAVTIVAPEDGTQVTVRSSARTQASPSNYSPAVPLLDKNQTHTFTLNQFDVLQLTSGPFGSNLQCDGTTCRRDNDLTGTIISSTKPVAVFGGTACADKPYNKPYCDHTEEQVFPFATWGKTYVAQKSHPVRVTTGGFATPSQMGADLFKVVASCPPSQCPNGTLITFSTPPAAADVLPPNRCLGASTIAANNCRLAGGDFMEFSSKANFTVTGDQPIAVLQSLVGQTATQNATTGDPSITLLPPAEQWRADYTVLTAPGIADNYLGIVYDDAKVGSVEVNGVVIGGFTQVGATSFRAKNHPVAAGSHTIKVNPKPGSAAQPSAGVIVYGFDSYVSYAYTGGLDLGSIVTGIDPGG